MFTLTEPSEAEIVKFLSAQSPLAFSYSEVGATRTEPGDGSSTPRGYNVDHNHVQLGRGAEVYERAVAALKEWRQFDLGWVSLVPRGVKIEKGATVAVKAWACGMWSLNACRVVYVVDEAAAGDPIARFGFAYGTLPDHIERGEERFLIEWNRTDDSVWYDILAFSQPRHPLVRIGFPVARMMQKRFARDSLSAMKSVVHSAR
ncbi:MAG TPA: DUF1990 domain-containing protein [Pyrinomonadaceae bacterium]|nr:DUF1990 domain-containing protein [Pyrinomonadaceae bacterium]